jgi:hypothetical protein|tara:strand:+ start:136 stop:432 length:297 start_codon:yes stop_codon:yes gene_type:complete
MRTRFETAADIFSLMYDANLSDSDQAADWQTPDMCYHDGGLYGVLYSAAARVLGWDFLSYLMLGDGITLNAEEIEDIWNDMPEHWKTDWAENMKPEEV